MQSRKKKFLPYFIVGLFTFYFGHFDTNYYLSLPGNDVLTKIDNITFENFNAYLPGHWIDLHFTPISLFVGGILFFVCLLEYLYRNDRGIYRDGEEHGSARFATQKEMDKFADKEEQQNIILTAHARMGLSNKRLPYDFQKNKNDCVIGGPGTGKTYTFVKPNLMQMNASYVVTDPKGLLVRETGKMFEEAGYQIKIFDLVNMANTDTFNVFNYIKTELDIDRVLEAITEGTKKSDNSGEDFWIQAEAMLMRSLLAYLWFDGREEGYTPNISMLAELLRNIERTNPKKPSIVERLMNDLNEKLPNNYAYKQWINFNNNFKEQTRMSVLAVAIARYGAFDHRQVVDMIEKDTMDIESWNEKKTVCFIAIPETNKAYNFIVSMMFAVMMETLRKKADKVLTGELKLDKPLLHVRFIIDEFANIGKIPNLDLALATFRSREMSIVIILQAMAQLKAMYKDGWETLVNTCDTVLFLGGDEENTTKYLSQRAGKQTISVRNRSESLGTRGSNSTSYQLQARDLMTPDEISRLQGGMALLFISGQYVFKDQKATVKDHPNYKKLADNPSDPNWYYYKRYKDEVEEFLDSFPKEVIELEISEAA